MLLVSHFPNADSDRPSSRGPVAKSLKNPYTDWNGKVHDRASPQFFDIHPPFRRRGYREAMSFHTNIESAEHDNAAYRRVLFTGERSQLVIMTIPPGGEIGEETHPYVEQALFFVKGSGTAVLDGIESPIAPGDVYVVTPGTRHNVINAGDEPLRIWTVYAPPNHIDGRVHATRAEAEADDADEKFGESVR